MTRRLLTAVPFALALAAAVLVVLAGCGEKIAIPEPQGQWSLAPYTFDVEFEDPESPAVLTQHSGVLYLVTIDALVKRNQDYEELARLDGLDQPQALCVDPETGYLILWQAGPRRLSWHDTQDLTALGFTDVAGVESVTGMATNPSGVGYAAGAVTFLYLSDPAAGVIHRYAFDPANGFSPYGILARSGGEGTRFVNVPAGLATDAEDSLLVCDADTNRNWVIRFVSTPDTTDTTPDPGDEDPLRGWAALFDVATCPEPAAADYVLGDAAECQENDWVGGPSDADGEFHGPRGVAVDNAGRIFVADTMNDRIQLFDPQGYYDLWFGNSDVIPGPISLALVEKRTGTTADKIFPAGYVYVLVPSEDKVVRYIDRDYFISRSETQPPPPPP